MSIALQILGQLLVGVSMFLLIEEDWGFWYLIPWVAGWMIYRAGIFL